MRWKRARPAAARPCVEYPSRPQRGRAPLMLRSGALRTLLLRYCSTAGQQGRAAVQQCSTVSLNQATLRSSSKNHVCILCQVDSLTSQHNLCTAPGEGVACVPKTFHVLLHVMTWRLQTVREPHPVCVPSCCDPAHLQSSAQPAQPPAHPATC